NTLVRDLVADQPEQPGGGRRRRPPWVRVDAWCAALPESAWTTLEVRDGEKGPVLVQAARTLVQARTEGRPSQAAETLVAFPERQGDGAWEQDYLLSNSVLRHPLGEVARVFQAQHRIEEGLP